ncbi:hypothetical protein KY285_030653 [Solanum tuberosum]|nr:hypothetical protein KY285_030653 [Solanum tuberosum]
MSSNNLYTQYNFLFLTVSMHVYLLATINPPKGIINKIHQMFAKFFWGKSGGMKDHPVLAKELGASHVWKMMIQVTEEVEHEFWWQVRAETVAFDGGTKRFDLEVKDFIGNNGWNKDKLQSVITEDMTNYIIESIKLVINYEADCPWCMGNTKGEFTVKSSFKIMRKKEEEMEWLSNIWVKGLPFKISFFHWRVWKRRISTNDNLKRMKLKIASGYHCCEEYKQETMEHLFQTSPTAQRLWKKFVSCAGTELNGVHLQQLIISWWKATGPVKIQKIFKLVLVVLMWELGKRRTARRHDRECPVIWEEEVKLLKCYKPKLLHKAVTWNMPDTNWIKCNTDGSSKGNPGIGTYSFCVRDERSDLIFAEAQEIGITTNNMVEATVALRGQKYCIMNKFRQDIVGEARPETTQ